MFFMSDYRMRYQSNEREISSLYKNDRETFYRLARNDLEYEHDESLGGYRLTKQSKFFEKLYR